MPDVDDFFESPQGAAALKHRLLRSYLAVFAGKLGSTSDESRVVFIDGYAGPGQYLDASPGSPMLAVETAKALSELRKLECYFIESKRPQYELLCDLLDQSGYDDWEARHGTAEDHLTDLVGLAGEAPLLVFLDPYGLTVPFDQLVETVLTRPERRTQYTTDRPTEVVFNFSLNAVRRMAGWLDKEYDTDQLRQTQTTMLTTLDSFFGGDWWRDIYRQFDSDDRGWIDAVLGQYLDRLRQAAGLMWASFSVDVADRYKGPPSYHLVLLTQHPDGLWNFNEAASLGAESLREFTLGGQQELDPKQRKRELEDTIEENLRAMIAEGKPFRLNARAGDVYGKVLAEARGKHVRPALKRLHAEGLIAQTPRGFKGDFGRFRVVPT